MNIQRHLRRKGSILVFVVVVMIAIFAVMALAVDLGYYYNVRRDLQTALDAATLAGASGLSTDIETAEARAIEYALKNKANGVPVNLTGGGGTITTGSWDSDTGFTELGDSATRASAIKITAHTTAELFFARIVGVNSLDVSASSVAVYGSRDIVVTLDYSGSMGDDSELKHVDQLGRSEIEGYLLDIWTRLKEVDNLAEVAATQMNLASTYISSSYSDNEILEQLGLRVNLGTRRRPQWQTVSYPYPPRDWDDYINYVQSSSRGSYRNRYGYLTWMDYLQANQFIYRTHHVPLFETPQQPITAVKNAVTIFLAYMEIQPTDDRVGLASYTSASGYGTLESPLTDDYALIEEKSRSRHAGYYHDMTNIAGGMYQARNELQTNGRKGALKLIVLLSDGMANYPGNTSSARSAALQEAREAAKLNIPIVTISLGAAADTNLMQQIADITGGIHFNVPGGNDVSDYEEDLNDIFARIAGHLPLKLVQ